MPKRIPLRYEPDYGTSPGEVLETYLLARGMTKADLASRCGRPVKTISEIVHAKASITAETALQLGRVLGQPASLWLGLEANYRLFLAKRHEHELLGQHSEWARRFPVQALLARGHIEQPASEADLVKQLLAFFGVGSVAGWTANFGHLQLAYRRSPAFKAAPESVTAWVRLGEVAAASVKCAPFNKRRFRETLADCRELTIRSFPSVTDHLVDLCAGAGVAVVLVPELPKTHLSGIARWLSPEKAMIQLSLRYKTSDHLWFTFFHEAAHVLLHGKKQIFVDEQGADLTEVEVEANRFASDLLINPSSLSAFVDAADFSSSSILQFAANQGIAPGIVVGRLQHDRKLQFSQLNNLKERLSWQA